MQPPPRRPLLSRIIRTFKCPSCLGSIDIVADAAIPLPHSISIPDGSHGSSSSRSGQQEQQPIWGGDCVLQEQLSLHPEDDFYNSMIEMVIFKRIAKWQDLKEMLTFYISNNPPEHHNLIEEAFLKLVADVYAPCN